MIRSILLGTWLLAGLMIAPARADEACPADPDAATGVNAVLYDQRSVEHALITEQIYRAATAALRQRGRHPATR